MPDVEAIARSAGMIVNGYAFTPTSGGRIRVLNLNAPESAAVLAGNGSLLETNMDDIEAGIVQHYYQDNMEFLEGGLA